MFRTKTQTANDWRDAVDELQTARKHYAENVHLMDDYNRAGFHAEFDERQKRYQPLITAGAISNLEAAYMSYNSALRGADQSMAREIVRWDPVKLNAELQVAQQLVDQQFSLGPHAGDIAANLDELLTEAKQAGGHKLRATCEVLKSLSNRGSNMDDNLKLNRVAQDAKRELADLRYTDEMKTAAEKVDQAGDVVEAAYREAGRAYQAIHGQDAQPHMPVSEIERQMYRTEVNRRTGELTIHKDYQTACDHRERDYVQGQR